MKTRIATLTLVLGMLLSVTAFANQPVPASKAVAKSVAKLIQSELEYPEFAIKDQFQGVVVLSILIEDDGSFDVQQANCINEDLKEHVASAVEEIISEKHARYAGQTLYVKVNFDLKLF